MQQTQQFREGDTLVNDDGSVTITIDAIDGDTVSITDSRDYHDDGEKSREAVRDAIDSGDFTVVRDSALTTIKGIGEATAPTIEAQTGCQTPSELVEAYFTDSDANIREAVRRTDYLNEWVIDNYDNLSLSLSLAEIKVMLFMLECDCTPSNSSISDTSAISHRYSSVDGEELAVDQLDWVDDGHWVGRSNIATVARGLDGLRCLLDDDAFDMWGDMDPCATHAAQDNGHMLFTHPDGGSSLISNEYLTVFQSLFSFELDDVHCHPDSDYPVWFRDEETDLVGAIAPRIHPP
jgi:hypothetical protein